jgi:hypothetical protein
VTGLSSVVTENPGGPWACQTVRINDGGRFCRVTAVLRLWMAGSRLRHGARGQARMEPLDLDGDGGTYGREVRPGPWLRSDV